MSEGKCDNVKPWYLSLAKSGRAMALILSSPRVTAEVFEARMRECMVCEFAVVDNGLIFCKCCGCPHIRLSTIPVKNAHKAWGCLRIPPAFPPLQYHEEASKECASDELN